MSTTNEKKSTALSKLIRLSKQIDTAIQEILTNPVESMSEELKSIKANLSDDTAKLGNSSKNIDAICKILKNHNEEFIQLVLGDIKRRVYEFKTLGVLNSYQK